MRRVLYPAYESRVVKFLPPDQIPQHVGVMLDGNRRWAKAVGLNTAEGYQAGADNIRPLLGWCEEVGVEVVTLWLLSSDNLTNRPAEQLTGLLDDHRGRGRVARRGRALADPPGRRARPAAHRDRRAAQGGRGGDPRHRRRSWSTSPSATAVAARSPTPYARCSPTTPRAAPRWRSSPTSSTSSTSPSTSTPRASPTPTW